MLKSCRSAPNSPGGSAAAALTASAAAALALSWALRSASWARWSSVAARASWACASSRWPLIWSRSSPSWPTSASAALICAMSGPSPGLAVAVPKAPGTPAPGRPGIELGSRRPPAATGRDPVSGTASGSDGWAQAGVASAAAATAPSSADQSVGRSTGETNGLPRRCRRPCALSTIPLPVRSGVFRARMGAVVRDGTSVCSAPPCLTSRTQGCRCAEGDDRLMVR